MSWDYVAGFFDGEGCAGVWGRGAKVTFSNNELAPLVAIRDFLQAGRIYSHPPGRNSQRHTAYVLSITKVEDLRRIIPTLLDHCLLRRDQLNKALASLAGRRAQHPTWGHLETVGVDEIRRLYWDERLNGPQIAARLGMKSDSVHHFMKRHGIPMRSSADALAMIGHHRLGMTDPELVRRLYWDERLTPSAIADQLGVSNVAVMKFMARHGIPKRTRAEAIALREENKQR